VKKVRSVIAIAGLVNANGNVYSAEALRQVAEEREGFEFDGTNLYFTMEVIDPDPEIEKIVDDNFWDLV